MFDNYPANRSTFIGEYASVQPNLEGQSSVNWTDVRWKFPYWIGTVSEAVFLIGAERNADKILGASYAPLFQNLDSYEWGPDLISYTADPSQDVKSTSYYLVELFSGTRMTDVLPAPATDSGLGPVYWVAGKNSETGSYIMKAAVYNSTQLTNSSAPVSASVTFDGVSEGTSGTLTVLTAPGPYTNNDIGVDVVTTTTTTVQAGSGGTFDLSLPDLSIALLEVKGEYKRSIRGGPRKRL